MKRQDAKGGGGAARAGRRRRSVSQRLLVSYVVVLVAFAVTLGWSILALRESARDARRVRDAYLPLTTAIGEALAGQNVMTVQLNHITAARNPADVRQWIETARRLRPQALEKIRRDAERRLAEELDSSGLREHVVAEIDRIARALADDDAVFAKLFAALPKGDAAAAERYRDQLVARETEGAKRLRALRLRVEEAMRDLTEEAQRREQRSIQLLVLLSIVTLVVGLVTSVYARRVLAPLGLVTERARAVAGGDLSPRPVVGTDDEIGELAQTFEDMVAAIHAARADLVQAERLATIGKMAAHITHEVRNPLSSISLDLELLEEELASAGPEARQLAAAIRKEVDRLSRIAERYLAAAREPRLRLTSEHLDDIVRECHDFMRPELERAGIDSRLEIDHDLPAIDLDEGQIRQAIINLVRNAREAMSDGGVLAIELRRCGERVELAIADDGPGIPGEARANVFDPFYTTKQRGTGLGLSITRAIVVAHGGTIRCEEREGGGTRFAISLPLTGESR